MNATSPLSTPPRSRSTSPRRSPSASSVRRAQSPAGANVSEDNRPEIRVPRQIVRNLAPFIERKVLDVLTATMPRTTRELEYFPTFRAKLVPLTDEQFARRNTAIAKGVIERIDTPAYAFTVSWYLEQLQLPNALLDALANPETAAGLDAALKGIDVAQASLNKGEAPVDGDPENAAAALRCLKRTSKGLPFLGRVGLALFGKKTFASAAGHVAAALSAQELADFQAFMQGPLGEGKALRTVRRAIQAHESDFSYHSGCLLDVQTAITFEAAKHGVDVTFKPPQKPLW